MDLSRLHTLIERYYGATASQADTDELRRIFETAGALPEELERERRLFLALEGMSIQAPEAEVPFALRARLDAALAAEAEAVAAPKAEDFGEAKRRPWRRFAVGISAAAALALLGFAGYRIVLEDTPQNATQPHSVRLAKETATPSDISRDSITAAAPIASAEPMPSPAEPMSATARKSVAKAALKPKAKPVAEPEAEAGPKGAIEAEVRPKAALVADITDLPAEEVFPISPLDPTAAAGTETVIALTDTDFGDLLLLTTIEAPYPDTKPGSVLIDDLYPESDDPIIDL